jgi:hypothetical protein
MLLQLLQLDLSDLSLLVKQQRQLDPSLRLHQSDL